MHTLDNIILTQPVDNINWLQSKANIIYVPLTGANLKKFYENIPFLKKLYRTIIVPDNVTIVGKVIKSARYVSELRHSFEGFQFFKLPKNNLTKPVLVDLSLAADVVHQRAKSFGKVRALDEFFHFLHNIFQMLHTHPILKEFPTVVIFDNSRNSLNDIITLVQYFKYKAFDLPENITDKYVFIYLGKIGYYPIITSEKVLRTNILRLINYTETLRKSALMSEDNNPLTTSDDQLDKIKKINKSIIRKYLEDHFKKQVTEADIDTVYNTVIQYVKVHSNLDMNWNSPEQAKRIIEEALKNSSKIIGIDRTADIKSVIKHSIETSIFKKEVKPEQLENPVKPLGLKMIKITNIKNILDPKRTKYEFDENLDIIIKKLIESLNDPDFGLTVLGVDKKVVDDSANRYNEYIIKVKPRKGRIYKISLRVPALIHDTYFKINGEYYVVNNQLMQKPIIKKSANAVQLKTNYSVITYGIQSAPISVKSYSDMVQKFLNDMKTKKKLKTAEVIDNTTEERLKGFGVPEDIIASLTYKKVQIA